MSEDQMMHDCVMHDNGTQILELLMHDLVMHDSVPF